LARERAMAIASSSAFFFARAAASSAYFFARAAA